MSFFSNRRQSDNDEDKPAPKPIPQHPVGFETVLGSGTSMQGSLICKGNIRLDGDYSGTLDINGNVLVGETAKVQADIDARNISIAGTVRGNVTGNKVQLLRTGRIWGDITANALTTEEGAFIDGKITMKSHEANRQKTDEVPVEQSTVEAPQVNLDFDEVLESENLDETIAERPFIPAIKEDDNDDESDNTGDSDDESDNTGDSDDESDNTGDSDDETDE